MADEIFQAYPTAKWEVDGTSIPFPVAEIKEGYANRLIPHKRPYREGARLDDTHSDPIAWQLTVEAYNSDDHEAEVDGANFYPTVLNELLDSFKVHETGTLTLPTRGPRRCRAANYERVERHDARDAAAVVLTFTEDNEDDADAADFQAPTAASIAKKTAEDAVRAAEEEGAGGDLLAQLNELGAGIEATLNAPGDFVGDIEAMASSIAHTVEKIEDTFAKTSAQANTEVQALMSNPSGSRAGRLNRKLSDTAAKASTTKQTNIGRTIVPRTFGRDLSVFAIAASVSNDATDVLNLNPALDPFLVLAGTTVRIYSS